MHQTHRHTDTQTHAHYLRHRVINYVNINAMLSLSLCCLYLCSDQRVTVTTDIRSLL